LNSDPCGTIEGASSQELDRLAGQMDRYEAIMKSESEQIIAVPFKKIGVVVHTV
jgi:hypothetical protein